MKLALFRGKPYVVLSTDGELVLLSLLSLEVEKYLLSECYLEYTDYYAFLISYYLRKKPIKYMGERVTHISAAGQYELYVVAGVNVCRLYYSDFLKGVTNIKNIPLI